MEVLKVEVPIETDTMRVRPDGSEVMALISNNCKADRLLHWRPLYHLKAGWG